MSIPYTFSTTTTDADPGNGLLRLSSATQNTSTVIRADLLDNAGATVTGLLDTFDDSTNPIKGFIRLVDRANLNNWLIFSVSAVASPAGYRNITVAIIASSAASPFTNGASLLLCFDRTGNVGTTGGWPAVLAVDPTSGANSPIIDTGQQLIVGSGTPAVPGQIVSAAAMTVASDTDVFIAANAEAVVNGVGGAALTSCTGLVGGIGAGDTIVAGRGGVRLQAGSDTPTVNVATGEIEAEATGIIRFLPGVSFNLEGTGAFFSLFEQPASTPAMIAGQGMFWIRNDTRQSPMFTDDTNADIDLLAGRIVAITHYDSGSGTHNLNARTTLVVVELVGGGSGGYGCTAAAAAQLIACSGGAGGAYCKALMVMASPGGSFTYAVGAAGGGGAAASPSDPGDGGSTTFNLGGLGVSVATAGGGTAASTSAMASGTSVICSNQIAVGGAAGISGAWIPLILADGNSGDIGLRFSGVAGIGGQGGSSGAGGGGAARRIAAGNGNGVAVGTSHGAGGGGGLSIGGTARAGGTGARGKIIVWEYEF